MLGVFPIYIYIYVYITVQSYTIIIITAGVTACEVCMAVTRVQFTSV